MDTHQTSVAQTCLNAAHDGTMTFPEIVGALIGAGFEGYAVDYRRDTIAYFLPSGESVALDSHPSGAPVAAAFDGDGIAAQVRWAQANPPGYSYAAFCRNVKAFGCAGYVVSFLGRRVLYFGRTAETHTEHFPQ